MTNETQSVLCTDCRRVSVPWGPCPDYRCFSPRLSRSLVHGHVIPVIADACRQDNAACGPSGAWFEPKQVEPKRSWFAKLFGRG